MSAHSGCGAAAGLIAQIDCTHRALLEFDGAGFAQSAEQELPLLQGWARQQEMGGICRQCRAKVAELSRTRRVLVSSTRRTVSAFLGLLQTSQTYNPPGRQV